VQSPPVDFGRVVGMPQEDYATPVNDSDPDHESLLLALQLQAEEEARVAEQTAAMERLQNEPEDAESLALAIRLQQEDDEQALRDALGVQGDDDDEPGSPSQFSYEQLMTLGQRIGEVSKGASNEAIEALRTMSYEEACEDSTVIVGVKCAICQVEFEAQDELRVLLCGHAEHAECIDQWLLINKSCHICCKEIVPSPPGAAGPPVVAQPATASFHSETAMTGAQLGEESQASAMMSY